jgi:hypothetical protein
VLDHRLFGALFHPFLRTLFAWRRQCAFFIDALKCPHCSADVFQPGISTFVGTAVGALIGETAETYTPVSPRSPEDSCVLDTGEEQEVTIACDFKPERIVVEPDAVVLHLMRKAAVAAL